MHHAHDALQRTKRENPAQPLIFLWCRPHSLWVPPFQFCFEQPRKGKGKHGFLYSIWSQSQKRKEGRACEFVDRKGPSPRAFKLILSWSTYMKCKWKNKKTEKWARDQNVGKSSRIISWMLPSDIPCPEHEHKFYMIKLASHLKGAKLFLPCVSLALF